MSLASQQFEPLLRRLGYNPSSVGTENIWKLSSRSRSAPVQSTIEILQRKEQFTISKCHMLVDCEKLRTQIQATAKKKFPKITSFSIEITDTNSVQCFIEVPARKTNSSSDQRSKDSSPGTVIGWTTSIVPHGTSLIVQITDAFSFGCTVPDWWTLLLRTTLSSLTPGLEHYWKLNNLFELSIPIWLLPVDTAQIEQPPEDSDLAITQPIRVLNGFSIVRKDRKIVFDLDPSGPAIQATSPIEILEARETADDWREFDRSLFSRLTPVGFDHLLANSPSSLLARIAVAPHIISAKDIPLTLPIGQLSAFPLTALSGAMIVLKQQEKSHDLIKLASDLLRRVRQKYGDLHLHEPLRRIVPEVLGDLWSSVDPNQAFKSWNAALEGKGPNPRIANKIAQLANETRNSTLEFSTLLSLCNIERRVEALKQIAYRLIELANTAINANDKTTGQLRAALESLVQKTNFDHKIVTTLAKILRQEENHLAALSLLELHANEHGTMRTAAELSELHATIGSI